MTKFKIYCFTIERLNLLNKLPPNILPFGLGRNKFPVNWYNEKNGKNIMHLNKHFGEATGMYWLWKNKFNDLLENDWVGFCQHRRFWLDDLYHKNHDSNENIYSKLLTDKTPLFDKHDVILLQPTKLKNETILEHFINNHGEKIILESFNLLEKQISNDFQVYLQKREFSVCNMFITKPKFFFDYCKFLFPFMDKILDFCLKNNLCQGKNIRLPIFFIERFTSFWFHRNMNVGYLSYAALNKYFTSNLINKYYNPLKTPRSFKLFPSILDV